MADAITAMAEPEEVKKVVEKNKKEKQPVKEQVQKDVVTTVGTGKRLLPNGKTYIETF